MKRSALAALVAAACVLAALPAAAQSGRVSNRGPSAGRGRFAPGLQGHTFVPSFGLRPVIQSRRPSLGFGFDFTHHSVLNRHLGLGRFHPGFRPGFHGGFSGGSHGNQGFAFGTFPFFPTFISSSSIIVVPQPVPVQFIPVQVPVQMQVVAMEQEESSGAVVAPGLPPTWPRLRIARDSLPPQRPAPPLLTLLVLKDNTIIPAADYWLEDGLIFYITSTGRQGSFAVKELDWQTTNHVNQDRNVTFTLRSPR